MKEFDYVIVGAGAAGCVLAHRLSANPAVSVALLEAGGSDKNFFVEMPKGVAKVMTSPATTWAYKTEPETANAFTPETWARGRLIGGSSSINGMVYVRGQPEDFDDIARQSSDDWSWQHIGAAYRAMESHQLGADATRGDSGPLHITLPDRQTALTEAMVEAGVAMGLPRKTDTNVPDGGPGIGYVPRTIHRGRRQSASVAFLNPIRDRLNLTVIPDALADKVNFDGLRAVSVSVRGAAGGATATYAARREIIIAAGAMASPGILQRSGVGPADLLRKLGIPVVHDSPQVGRNLREHRCMIVQWKLCEGALSENNQFSGWRLLRNVLQYALTRKGAMTSAAYEVGAWFCSQPGATRPDVQFLAGPFSLEYNAREPRLKKDPGMCLVGYPLRPTSRGEINIVSRDPAQLPMLKPNYRSTEEDRALLVATIRLARCYADQAPLKQYIVEEVKPGPGIQSDEQIIDAFDHIGTCGYHAIGSCRMGADADSVVDPELRVRGVEGLRVCDTSIMPQIPAGNTNGPTMVMAWRAADIILRDHA